MEIFLDGATLESIGYCYSTEEIAAAIFALQLYGDQLTAGNIIDDPTNKDVPDLIVLINNLKTELQSGLTAVTPPIHKAMTEIFLPYIVRMHQNLPITWYEGVCEQLEVKPFELFSNALIARRMVDDADQSIALLSP